VHIIACADEQKLKDFYSNIVHHPPVNAHITHHHAALVAPQEHDDFFIQCSDTNKHPDLLITPDFGLCDDCRRELFDENIRRYHYPFSTWSPCWPPYSIITRLLYDRPETTMEVYDQCWQCQGEYHDPLNRRYYSQTNSCVACGITMHMFNSNGAQSATDYEEILWQLDRALSEGKIAAVKGVGGYLLMCDATNEQAIRTLRERKHRPSKPFALLYADMQMVEGDVEVSDREKTFLQHVTAPIVLCKLRKQTNSSICVDAIAPGLQRLGIMLPYSPILALIASRFGKPLIATSGNVSGSPILYSEDDAIEHLTGIADCFVTYDRDKVVPQDDSVIQLTSKQQQKIILRRSRGLAPNYFTPPFTNNDTNLLAMGAELKSSFALLEKNRCYVSQFLGDQENYEAQQAFQHTLKHLTSLLHFQPEKILADKHPAYFVSHAARQLAEENRLPLVEVQHHEAHLCAVLAENNLLECNEPILGVVWDGTGYGNDHQIWGGECVVYDCGDIERVSHLDYFPIIAGDKMPRQPRLSALVLTHTIEEAIPLVKQKFTEQEWNYYEQLLQLPAVIHTSSMGRLLDGIDSLLNIRDTCSYEGEATMQLQSLAESAIPIDEYYDLDFDNVIHWQPMLQQVVHDVNTGVDKATIAYKVHLSLAKLVKHIAATTGILKIAFSGGVFQNSLLVDMLMTELSEYDLYFHQQLSPNDECISFGQLAYEYVQSHIKASIVKQTSNVNQPLCV